MPELPEVETVKQVLAPQIKGQKIVNITVNKPEVIAHPGAAEFKNQLIGQTIKEAARRGKFLIIMLRSGDRIVLHLRMTGCLLLTPPDFPKEKHTHIIFQLSGKKELRFSDTRRFGRLWFFKKNETDTYSGIGKLGPEPFDESFSAEYFAAALKKRRKTIKQCLLDQSLVAGIGNIYSDEILFAARIYPARPAQSLTDEEINRIFGTIPKCLLYFCEKNKITPEKYLKTKGKDYQNTPFLKVYGHEGEPCPACGTKLCRIIVGGRSSVYCPKCQKDK